MKIFQQAVIFFNILFWLASPRIYSQEVARTSFCQSEKAGYSKAKDLFSSGQYLLSALHFSLLSVSTCDPQLGHQALFSYALSMAQLGEMSEVWKTLNQIELLSDKNLLRKSRLFRAFYSIQDLVPSGSFESNTQDLDSEDRFRLRVWANRTSPQFFESDPFLHLNEKTRIELKALQLDLLHTPQKSPWVAGIASAILPGSGQVYVNNFQSGAVAFLLNSLFLATTIELARNGLPIAATASGLVFSVTYMGNILNAVDAAKKYNEASRRGFDHSLQNTLFPELRP